MRFICWTRIYTFLLTMLLTVAAFANTAVDLRPQLPPVRNQGRSNWCASYAVADLLSIQLGRPVSAVAVATNYYVYRSTLQSVVFNGLAGARGPMDYDYGLIRSVFDANLGQTLCTQSDLPDDLSGISFAPFNSGIRSSRATGLNAFTQSCAPVAWPSSPLSLAGHDLWPGFSVEKLDRVLESGKPAALLIDLDRLFFTGRSSRVSFGRRGLHAVTAVARREGDSEQEYLLRVSWGDSCENMRGFRNIRECDGGNLWITAKALREITRSMLYFN